MAFTFQSFLESVKEFLPLAVAFVPGGQLAAPVTAAITHLPDIINDVEVQMSDAPGAQKKAAALIAAKHVTSTMADVSSGGQKATWTFEDQKMGALIDSLVGQANQASAPPPQSEADKAEAAAQESALVHTGQAAG